MGKGIQTRNAGGQMMAPGFTKEQVELIKSTVAKGTTDAEFQLFLYTCKRTGLDPLIRQIHAVKRWDGVQQKEVMAIQVGIDGYRLTAQRTEEMDGQDGPFWCAEDGEWKDFWTSKEPPAAAKVIVFRKGHTRPYTGIARYEAYVQRKKAQAGESEGKPNAMWAKMPDGQLAKCAEALALRKAFPNELAGTHTEDELAHADGSDAPPFKEPVDTTISSQAKPVSVVKQVKGKLTSAKGMKDTATQVVSYQVTINPPDGGVYVFKTDSEDLARIAKANEGKEVVASIVENPETKESVLTSIMARGV